MMQAVVEGGTGTAAQISGRHGRRQDGHRRDRRRGPEHDLVHLLRRRRAPGGGDRGRRRAAELDRRRDGRADRRDDHAGAPPERGELLTWYADYGRRRHPHRHALRRALPDHPQARLGRDGERLPRRGPGARPPRRDQDPRRPPRAATSSSSSGSGARRRTPPGSRTRTSSRSTTAARPRAPTTSRWSTSRGGR